MKVSARRFPRLMMALWLACSVFALPAFALMQGGVPAGAAQQPGPLTREQAAAIMPATVFFRGQTATVQARNTAGMRLAGGKLILASRVDTGGYSSGIAEKYQAYLITEVPLVFGDRTLAPGAYGFGMLPDDRLVFMDVGGNDVLTTPTAHDAAMPRPMPLQMTGNASAARLYLGRTYAGFSVAAGGR